ncbi:MAG: DUF3089 domain-containing protein [Saprospiraceae bacterium]|nr:DUF3089 domain-containing protein [Saprospiraceae bacterium]MDW8229986.1 DUF3089 domain-containing protein [Saprospiraceae bacterium]
MPDTTLLKSLLYSGALALAALAGCRSTRPTEAFSPDKAPLPPNYALLEHWAAHPQKTDAADRTPCGGKPDQQQTAYADVFFLHPTSYFGCRKRPVKWNADLNDSAINARTDSGAILHQATIFNTVGRVYAPRYRQAHLKAFYGRDTLNAAQALALAYQDVEAAFDHYLKHWHEGRPLVLVGHSQGAYLAMRLLRERIEGTPLHSQLVVAYLVGWPVRKDFIKKTPPCTSAEQFSCFCSWRTWRRDARRRLPPQPEVTCTNPLTWSTREGEYADRSLNSGAVLRNFCTIYPAATDAEVWQGYLLASRPRFPGSFLFTRKNYHVGDLNLYYLNVQQNVERRVEAFMRR